VHFIGIGGAGVSGVALVAHKRGIKVTGSDLKESRYMRALLREGVQVSVGHDAANVADPSIEVVVVSTAIPENNPELAAARERGIEVWPRARMLAYLGHGLQTLAVAGTHGKTTTSSMLATALARLDTNPTFLIGGVVGGFDATAYAGQGPYFVVEADESDGSFVELDPSLALVTNIECDHLDHYANLEAIQASFNDFLAKVTPEGDIVLCADCLAALELNPAGHPVHTYGLAEDADYRCLPGTGQDFNVVYPDGEERAFTLGAVPGVHNMVNATGVAAALDILGFGRALVADAIGSFEGVGRRFDRIGEARGVAVVDDYGHHPTEIDATLAAAAQLGYRKVHVLFQPHRYSRVEALINDFGAAFGHADSVTVMDIYSAGEAPIPGVNAQLIVDAICAHDPAAHVRHIHQRSLIPAAMAAQAERGDLIITMGAGDVTQLAPQILTELQKEPVDAK
jgi:UDP-N-acetylmuramate--alanine ligase